MKKHKQRIEIGIKALKNIGVRLIGKYYGRYWEYMWFNDVLRSREWEINWMINCSECKGSMNNAFFKTVMTWDDNGFIMMVMTY